MLPAPAKPEPTRAELMRELADAIEVLEGLEDDDMDAIYDAQFEIDNLEAQIAACSRTS